jgi:zinc D-Ala-D-Ala carboxypeptidase
MPDKSRYFSREELKCPCGCERCEMDVGFLMALDILRDHWRAPLVPNSAFRCRKHNKAVGGEDESMHIYGRAVDFPIKPNERYKFVELVIELGFHGIGIMANAIHLDNRLGAKTLFHYYGKEKKKK